MSAIKFKRGHHPDYLFIFCVVFLVILGLVMLSSASSDLGKIKFNDTYYYLKHQLLYGLSLGLLGFLIASFIYYRWWQNLAVVLLLISLVGLALVFTPLGFSHAGATRWLNLGFISVQPSEFLKLTFIIYLAAWLSSDKSRQTSFLSGLLPFLIISGLIGVLIILQPSTTTFFIIMAASLMVYFISGARISFVLGIIFLGLLCLSLVIAGSQYRRERITTYFNKYFHPEIVDVQTRGYHLNQALMAIGSGGLWGVGFGESTTKFRYLPEPIGDSIFAVVAEELGFIGAIILIGIFLTLFIRGFMIAKNSPDQFAKLTVVGLTSVIALQTFIHIGAISGLIPLTGVSLPFISYGGTSLAVFLTMTGIIVNISKYT